jgi:SAM-dependent methyltransferase
MALADLATPMAVRVAATLSLVEHAGTGGATVEQLASDTGTHAQSLGFLLDHLVTVGVFDLDPTSGRYRPTDLGAQMGEDAPQDFKRLLDINSAGGRGELAFVELLETIKTGNSAYVRRYGRDFWEDLDDDPKLRSSFDAQMNWRFQVQGAQIAERFDWSRFPTIVDVGGGDGAVLRPILHAHPDVRGQVVELPPTAAAATARFAAEGLTDRATAVPGSFFDPLPTGADAYILSDIIHNWDDDHSRQVLTRCREAATPHGTVVVIEPVLGNGASTSVNLFMVMCFSGRERTLEDLTKLAADCGLTLRATKQVADGRTALEFAVAPTAP